MKVRSCQPTATQPCDYAPLRSGTGHPTITDRHYPAAVLAGHAIAEARGATVRYVVGSRQDPGTDPLAGTALRRLAPGVHRMDVCLCGPPGVTGTAVAARTEAGVPRRRIHYESFEF